MDRPARKLSSNQGLGPRKFLFACMTERNNKSWERDCTAGGIGSSRNICNYPEIQHKKTPSNLAKKKEYQIEKTQGGKNRELRSLCRGH